MNNFEQCQKLTVAIQQAFIDSRLIAHHKIPEKSDSKSSAMLFWNTDGNVGSLSLAFNDQGQINITISAPSCKGIMIHGKFNKQMFNKQFQRFMRDYTGQKKRNFVLDI